ncbi:MAG: cell envelope integrity protein TolA [Candidatus Aegiribacteria sp.]
MNFSDRDPEQRRDYSPRRLDFVLAGAGHLILLLVGAVTFSGSVSPLSGGDDAMMVRMVTVTSPREAVSGEVSVPEEVPEEVQEMPEEVVEEVVEEAPEEIVEEVEEAPEEIPEEIVEEVEEAPEEVQEETPGPRDGFAAVGSQGDAGAGAPGPGTYESRVFNAVRRGYRTSVTPGQSYRVVLTVFPDGSTQVETVRRSGTAAFDRAVENALAMAQIPPMPPGRTDPVVIRIEFQGPE